MKVISIINYKGGVGKTTLTANLGGELAFRGKKVLMIDLDPQASLTFSFIKPDEWDQNFSADKTIKNWFESVSRNTPRSLKDLIFSPEIVKKVVTAGKLDLIASHLGLINVDLELATELGGANLTQAKFNYLKVHKRLSNGLKELEGLGYDVILIDCPPNFNIVTKNAIVASELVLIPAKPDYLSTLGIDYLRRSLASLIKDYNEYITQVSEGDVNQINPKILGVVFTMVQYYDGKPISTIAPFIQRTKDLGVPCFENMLRENKTIFGDAAQHGIPTVLLRYSNPSHKNAASEIEGVVKEFIHATGI